MAAFGTHDLGVVSILLGGAAGVAVYVAVLLLLRAVTLAELRAGRDLVAAKFGRRRPPTPDPA
jgi:hypothetical protein